MTSAAIRARLSEIAYSAIYEPLVFANALNESIATAVAMKNEAAVKSLTESLESAMGSINENVADAIEVYLAPTALTEDDQEARHQQLLAAVKNFPNDYAVKLLGRTARDLTVERDGLRYRVTIDTSDMYDASSTELVLDANPFTRVEAALAVLGF